MINSQEYWNNRFLTGDWETHSGRLQSEFYAALEFDSFPEWFDKELQTNTWSCVDYGCAEGDGTAYLAKQFPHCQFCGVDFSEDAIKRASLKFASCKFCVGNLEEYLNEYDVVFTSHTLEHFKDPYNIFERLVMSARKYAVILLPFEDDSNEKEHFYIFKADFFPSAIGKFYMSFFKIIDCRDKENTKWKGKHVLVIYTNSDYRARGNHDLENVYYCHIEKLNQQLTELEEEYKVVENMVNTNRDSINQLVQQCNDLAQVRSFKLVHFLRRFKHQFLKNNISQKKEFIKWVMGHKQASFIDTNHEYNPLCQIIDSLQQISDSLNLKRSLVEEAHKNTMKNIREIKKSNVNKK